MVARHDQTGHQRAGRTLVIGIGMATNVTPRALDMAHRMLVLGALAIRDGIGGECCAPEVNTARDEIVSDLNAVATYLKIMRDQKVMGHGN